MAEVATIKSRAVFRTSCIRISDSVETWIYRCTRKAKGNRLSPAANSHCCPKSADVQRRLWSRRITQEHRLVYRVAGEAIDFLQARYHY
ncbi:MAG TPA: type II toxin-antitoxin system YoeB family toxin [Bryobacteraceae bacterium]|nr:type II toxin-antitoxin system YoeB family toxin [Bryobacteraceae bacterium]